MTDKEHKTENGNETVTIRFTIEELEQLDFAVGGAPPIHHLKAVGLLRQQLKRLENYVQRGDSSLAMKSHLLLTTIAAVVLVGCGESQESAPAPETKPVEPVAEAPDISIIDAAKAGNIEAVKQHLATGADVNAKDEGGVTPLHGAAIEGHKEITELLIAAGTDVNSKNVVGMTPLHYAAQQGHKETAELLIANGADVNVLANDGTTPLDWARAVWILLSPEIKAAKKEIANLLRKHGGKKGKEWKAAGNSIHSAASAGHIEAVKQHLAAGADVNAKDSVGWTALHQAAYGGHKEPIELLIAEGADVNAKDKNGYTPIWIANQSNH